jgi:voltage-gated potassium channel
MDEQSGESTFAGRLIERRIEKKGLRPRVAAAVIATLWLIAIVVFGIVEHLLDKDTFGSIWSGMWWATQTVTTVGYGDIVPKDAVGQVVAALLMIGGLSLFAVVTGSITSAFVTAAQARRGTAPDPALEQKLDELTAQVAALRAELARGGSAGPPSG